MENRSATMVTDTEQNVSLSGAAKPAPRIRLLRSRTSLTAAGEPMIWLTGGALGLCLVMIVGLLALILFFGISTFWPLDIVRMTTLDGSVYMGESTRNETYEPQENIFTSFPPGIVQRARDEMSRHDGLLQRQLIRTGNYRLTQSHFQWIDDFLIKDKKYPEWAIVMERSEWGRFYGFPEAFAIVRAYIDSKGKTLEQIKEEAFDLMANTSPEHGGEIQLLAESFLEGGNRSVLLPAESIDSALNITGVAEVVSGPSAAWAMFRRYHDDVRERWIKRRHLEKYDTGKVNQAEENARLAVLAAKFATEKIEAEQGISSSRYQEALASYKRVVKNYEKVQSRTEEEFASIRRRIDELNTENGRYLLNMKTAGEGTRAPQEVLMRLDQIVRAYPANQLSFGGKIRIYLSRWWEYLTDEPREANSEGGIFPAIFGTVVMTLLMALAVVPFGVLAALYLREYARAGPIVSAVRIAVNNLAGVPSIVFGVFGLGFFCYGVGGFIDGGPAFVVPKPGWFLLLGIAVLCSIAAFVTFFLGLKRPGQRISTRQLVFKYVSGVLWVVFALFILILIATTPFFDGFYRARLPNPTFGKGALIWSSFTLALLTLPVVIVATEEALAAVPNSLREGSYACGASKWQTIQRIILPRALPGIMTGAILAMARGAGEVAPLMLVGAVKLAPELPFDWLPPFGINRSFMHLGFHIYDVGFQSQNSEAAKPMVYTTTLLLISIIAILNITAVWLRSRLKKRFHTGEF